jgi:anti-anti-sigma regulatory factor
MSNTQSLEPILDLRAAEALKRNLEQWLDAGKALAIDASRVSRISTACVQLIAAFVIAARNSGMSLVFESKSPTLEAAFTNLGLSALVTEQTT